MQHQRFGEHGELGGSEFILPVMANDQVLDKRLHFEGKVRQRSQLLLQHLELDDHVPEQLSAAGVGERAIVGQFVNFADVMEERTGQQKVAIDLGIVARDQVAGAKQGNHVIEQTADIGVVKALGGGRVLVRVRNFAIRHE